MKGPGKIIRTALSAGASAVILVFLAASFGVSKASRNKTVCNDVSVTIRDSLQSRFVSGKDTRSSGIIHRGEKTFRHTL